MMHETAYILMVGRKLWLPGQVTENTPLKTSIISTSMYKTYRRGPRRLMVF